MTRTDYAAAVPVALLAGMAATAAMTLGQMIEQRFTDREESRTPAQGIERATGVEPATDEGESQLNNAAHWLYGTAVGLTLLSAQNLSEPARTASLFAGIWGLGVAMESFANPDAPVTQWTARQIGIDGLHHLVYAVTLGLVGGALLGVLAEAEEPRER